MRRALVLGGSGGIGAALVNELHNRYPVAEIIATCFKSPIADGPARYLSLDVTDEQSICRVLRDFDEFDWVINAVGFLHDQRSQPEKTIRKFAPDVFHKNMMLNTLPTLLLGKYIGEKFKHGRNCVFATVSAKVGSIEDNCLGGWHSYRCAKAALNMALKNISIEWQRTHPNVCVAALHPGTTDTALSKPFQKNVPPEKLFPAAKTANYLLDLIVGLTPDKSGQFWSWDGSRLPW